MPRFPNRSKPAFTYRWNWVFQATPERVWPFVSDTQRFNEATGVPTAEVTETPDPDGGSRRTLRIRRFGLSILWDEYPFEWIQPQFFGVLRVYLTGPVAWMRVNAELEPLPDGTTRLTYEIQIHPSNLLGYIAIPIQINCLSRRAFDRVFRQIGESLRSEAAPLAPFPLVVKPLQAGAMARMAGIARSLSEAGHPSDSIDQLMRQITEAPDADLMRMRPFALADNWGTDRFETLELCLHAARLGLLDVNWALICPECRGAPSVAPTLANISRHVHCSSCNIDFEVDFDHSIEVIFHPNPGIKKVDQGIYCVGGPQNTPHIIMQQVLAPNERRVCNLPVATGSYRIRGPRVSGQPAMVEAGKTLDSLSAQSDIVEEAETPRPAIEIVIDKEGLHPSCERLGAGALSATFENRTLVDQVVIIEHTSWSNQAATAAQVTTLQAFRDLFSSEALRPMEQIAVTSLTILFTDLKGSTAIYRTIGDAPAFRRVMDHFTILRDSIVKRHGGIVKTIGDAVMAAFADPANGVAAALDMLDGIAAANEAANNWPLTLKIGLHLGPCIAITQNDRLDYFGSTVNIAARIEAQSNGNELVVSEAVLTDPGARNWLEANKVSITPFHAELKGYQQPFPLFRIRKGVSDSG